MIKFIEDNKIIQSIVEFGKGEIEMNSFVSEDGDGVVVTLNNHIPSEVGEKTSTMTFEEAVDIADTIIIFENDLKALDVFIENLLEARSRLNDIRKAKELLENSVNRLAGV